MIVSIAYLQAATSLPGLGTFSTLSQEKAAGIKMRFVEYGLIVTKGNQSWLIPAANVKVASLVEDPSNKPA